MFKAVIAPIKGAFFGFLIFLNLFPIPLLILMIGSLNLMIPKKRWRHAVDSFIHKRLVPAWVDVNSFILHLAAPKLEIVVKGEGNLSEQGWYCIIANHQSWIDILMLQRIFNHQIPVLKFFMKQSLLWKLPVIGLTCWLLNFPFMKRYSKSYLKKHPEKKGTDLEETRKSCERFKEQPIAVANFIEGTRFSKEKKQRQSSPYQNLLYPRAGGLSLALYALQDCLQEIIDVTIVYPLGEPNFWDLLCGKMKKIVVYYKALPIPPTERKEFQKWLNNLWQQKDQLITSTHD